MSIENTVKAHYDHPDLIEETLRALRESGIEKDGITLDNIAVQDEFHIGGRPATEYLGCKMALKPGSHVLDVGAGIGGPARYLAATYDLKIRAIDLTPAFKDTSDYFCALLGLDDKISFDVGNALDMPYDDHEFDAAYTIHVGMNIQDKAKKYQEVFRTLKPGSSFTIYDIMRGPYDIMRGPDAGHLAYPLPWANDENSSFLETPEIVQTHLTHAGFQITGTEDRREFALSALEKLCAKIKEGKHKRAARENLLQKMENLKHNMERGLCAPWIITAAKPETGSTAE